MELYTDCKLQQSTLFQTSSQNLTKFKTKKKDEKQNRNRVAIASYVILILV